MKKLYSTFFSLGSTVQFDQTMFSVSEDAGELTSSDGIILSNPSLTDFTIELTNGGGSATCEYCSILINYVLQWYD